MLSVVFRIEEQFLNLRVERSESLARLGAREVDGHIGSRGDNVKLWIKDVDSVNDSVEPGHSKGSVSFILPHSIVAEIIYKMKSFLTCMPRS